MDVVDAIAAVECGEDDRPLEDVIVNSVTIGTYSCRAERQHARIRRIRFRQRRLNRPIQTLQGALRIAGPRLFTGSFPGHSRQSYCITIFFARNMVHYKASGQALSCVCVEVRCEKDTQISALPDIPVRAF